MTEDKIFERLQERFPYLICSEPRELLEDKFPGATLKARIITDNLLRFTGNIILADSLRSFEEDEETSIRVRSFLNDPGLLRLLELQETFARRNKKRAIEVLGLGSTEPSEAPFSLGRFLKLMEKYKAFLKNEAIVSQRQPGTFWTDSSLNSEVAEFVIGSFRSEVVHLDLKESRGYYLKSSAGWLLFLFPFFVELSGGRMGLFESFSENGISYIETGTGRTFRTDSEEVVKSFGEYLMKIGLYTRASECFRKAGMSRKKGESTDAERACESALKGYRAYQAGDFDGAVRELSRAVRLRPDLSQIYIQLALSYSKLNEIDEAISVLGKLLDMHPSIQRALELMGDLYMEKGDYSAADVQYQGVLRANPSNRSALKKIEKAREKMVRRNALAQQEIESEKVGLPSRKLEEFMEDMNALAEQGRYHPAVGRDEEIGTILNILCCRTKNNPLIIGEPGVGKSAIIEGLVLRALAGDVPPQLAGKKFYLLSVATLLAGTKYRGQFEERMLDLLKEIREENCVIVIDNIHTIISAGLTKGGSLDTSALLKPALIRGEIQVIGTTVYDEYQNNIEKDLSLARCFQKVNIAEPDGMMTTKIIRSLLPSLEEYHSVSFEERAVSGSVGMIGRYIREGAFPDKAIDVLDRAAAIVSMRGRESAQEKRMVTEEEILEVVSAVSGVPLAKIRGSGKESLKNLGETLERRIIGQHDAIEKVSRIIRSSLLGFKLYPQRPNAVFLFVGPTGVGKTELAKALADSLFGDEEKMIRIDMSEYMERISSTRLIGSSPGYVGYNDQNQLTDKLRQNPYAIVLLDEMEKADAEMINLFLQVFDAGRLTDGRGRTVTFNSSIIIMTSNIGTDLYFRQLAGYGASGRGSPSVSRGEIMKEIRKSFSPEFLNRIDEIVFFGTLGTEDVKKIALLQLDALKAKLLAEGKDFVITEKALDILSKEGYSFEFGARNLGRVVREKILDPIAVIALDERWASASVLTIQEDGDDLKIVLAGENAR